MTMSIDPTIAGTSAIRQPAHSGLVTLRFEKLDDLARSRSGTASSLAADDVELDHRGDTRLEVDVAGMQMLRLLDAMILGRRRVLVESLLDDLDALDHPSIRHVAVL